MAQAGGWKDQITKMKVKVYLKDPDGFSNAIDEAVCDSMSGLIGHIDDEECDAIQEIRREEVRKKLQKWVQYGECIDVEFDLELGTAIILEQK